MHRRRLHTKCVAVRMRHMNHVRTRMHGTPINRLDNAGFPPAMLMVEDVSVLQAAEELLAQAHAFHAPVGVKTLREKIEMRIRALNKRLPHGGADAAEGDADLANHAVDAGQSASLTTGGEQ